MGQRRHPRDAGGPSSRAKDIKFNDGWYVQGLKGTGSFDYSAEDVFVPQSRTFPLFRREPYRGSSPATRMGLMPVTAAGHASWALGVAKSMLDDAANWRRRNTG